MSQTRYCSTCGALLSQGAVVCGECGARFQESPFHKKATEAPSAWGAAPVPRSAEEHQDAAAEEESGVRFIAPESLEPKAPGMTALRPGAEQYDRTMAEHHPTQSESAAPTTAAGALPYPLDGCVPASVLKRVGAYLIDAVVASIVSIPVAIGAVIIALSGHAGLIAQILIGIGVVLPVVLAIVLIWLEGTKGITIGKAALGLRTVRLSKGGPIGVGRALGRAALLAIPVVGLVMALFVLFDPQRVGRGLHDRALDAVVIDVRQGRNGIKPRPDDFERHGAEHYLPSRPVEVRTHDNLMSAPGAAWGVGSADAPPSATGAQGGADAAPGASDSSQWAPHAGVPGEETPGGASWQGAPAAQSVPPSPSAPAEHPPQDAGWGMPDDAGWGVPSAPSGSHAVGTQPGPHEIAPAPSPAPGWGEAAPESGGWGQPAAPGWGEAPPAAQDQSQQQAQAQPHASAEDWGQPAAPGWGEATPPAQDQAQPQASAEDWGQPAAAPVAEHAQPSAPEQPGPEPSATAAPGGAVAPEVEDDEDDATRVARPSAPPAARLRIRVDDGAELEATSPAVIGRNPSAGDGAQNVAIADSTRSISKTHLRLDVDGDRILVTDLGSTNGTAIAVSDADGSPLTAHEAAELPDGARIALGERTIVVELVS